MSMPFCPNCGAQTQPGTKFCTNCGSSLQQAQTPPPPPITAPRPAQGGEQVYATMSGLTKGILGRDNYVMLITQKRLMFIKLSGDDRKNIGNAITEQAKADGAGFLGRIAAGINANNNLGNYFIGWTPQQVSAQYGNVMSVEEQSVKELRIRTINNDVDSTYTTQYELRIKSTGYNEKFRLTQYNKEENRALKELLGKRFKSGTWFL